MELKGKKINFLGDSWTAGGAVSDIKYAFVNRIEAMSGAAVCRNYGEGGTTIAKMQKPYGNEYDRDFCMRADSMDDDADVIVVLGGTNDFGHGSAPLGEFSDRTPDTFYGAMHTLCLKLLNKYPTSTIVFITPNHRVARLEGEKGEDTPNAYGAVLYDYVKIIREVTEYYALPLLDLYATSGIQPNVPIIREKLMPDGLHPNDDGHKIVADKIYSFLKAL